MAAVLVVLLNIIALLFPSCRPSRPTVSFVKNFLRVATSASAAVASASRSCSRQAVGGLAGVVLLCIGSFSNSFVEAEAAVAFHAHVVAGMRFFFPEF